jgi:predicted RNase H-like HicB family nuclease
MTKMTRKPKRRDGTAEVSTKARKIASGYTLMIKADPSLGHVGWAIELPTVMADGATPEDCLRRVVFSIELAVDEMLKNGDEPPGLKGRERRAEQVNVRLTHTEKQILSKLSAREGFRGVGDFIRVAVLKGVNPR